MAEEDYKSWIADGHYHSLTEELPHSFLGVQKYIPLQGPEQSYKIKSKYEEEGDGIKITFYDQFSADFNDFAKRFTFKKRKSTDNFLMAEADSQVNDPYLSPDQDFELLAWTLTKGDTILVENGENPPKKIVLGITTMSWLKKEDSKIETIRWKWQGYNP